MCGAHADALRAAMRAADASAVFASERFEPAHVANDARVAAALARENLSVTLLPGHLLFDPRATEIDMGAEKYYFGTLMPYVHAAEKTGGKPGVPRPAPPAALAGAADAASIARVSRARLRAACEKRDVWRLGGARRGRAGRAPRLRRGARLVPRHTRGVGYLRGWRGGGLVALQARQPGAVRGRRELHRGGRERRLAPLAVPSLSGKSRRVACTTSCPWRRNPPDRGPGCGTEGARTRATRDPAPRPAAS